MTLPLEEEAEKASNSYLMSLIAIMAGLPMPIINLIATAIFFLGNRKASYFVRWHCTQALLSQAITLMINAPAIYWTLSIIFGSNIITNSYIAYIITAVFFNLLEFIATVYAAARTRKGHHVEWWLFGPLAHVLVKA
jgi:uncharacterized membrane protein